MSELQRPSLAWRRLLLVAALATACGVLGWRVAAWCWPAFDVHGVVRCYWGARGCELAWVGVHEDGAVVDVRASPFFTNQASASVAYLGVIAGALVGWAAATGLCSSWRRQWANVLSVAGVGLAAWVIIADQAMRGSPHHRVGVGIAVGAAALLGLSVAAGISRAVKRRRAELP